MNPNDPNQVPQPPQQPPQQPEPATPPPPPSAPTADVAPQPPQPTTPETPAPMPEPQSVAPAPVAPAPNPNMTTPQPTPPQSQPQVPGSPQAVGGQMPNAPSGGNKNKLIIIIVAAVVAVGGLVVALLIVLGGDSYASVEGTGSLSGTAIEYPSSYIQDEEQDDGVGFLNQSSEIEGCSIDDSDTVQRALGLFDLNDSAGVSSIADFTDNIDSAAAAEAGVAVTVEETDGFTRVQVSGIPDSVFCDGESKDINLMIVYYLVEGSDDALFAGVAGIPYEGSEVPSTSPEDGHAKEMITRFQSNNSDKFE